MKSECFLVNLESSNGICGADLEFKGRCGRVMCMCVDVASEFSIPEHVAPWTIPGERRRPRDTNLDNTHLRTFPSPISPRNSTRFLRRRPRNANVHDPSPQTPILSCTITLADGPAIPISKVVNSIATKLLRLLQYHHRHRRHIYTLHLYTPKP